MVMSWNIADEKVDVTLSDNIVNKLRSICQMEKLPFPQGVSALVDMYVSGIAWRTDADGTIARTGSKKGGRPNVR